MMKSITYKILPIKLLLIAFAVHVNAQVYVPVGGTPTTPGIDGPDYRSGPFLVCELDQRTVYNFLETHSSGLIGSRFRFRIDTGSIITDPTGTTLRQLSASQGHYAFNGNPLGSGNATATGWEYGYGIYPGTTTANLGIIWKKPGTYTLYASRYTNAFSYTSTSTNQNKWTAVVIIINGGGIPPEITSVSISPAAVCSGETATATFTAQGNNTITPTGYRFYLANDSANISILGFPHDTIIESQYTSGVTMFPFNLRNVSDSAETIKFYITPLGGINPIGSSCDGANDSLSLTVYPQVVNPNIDTTLCKGISINIADLINSVITTKTAYSYVFYSDAAGTIPVTSLAIANIMRDTVFYIQATDTLSKCTSEIATLTITTGYIGIKPIFKNPIDTLICMGGYVDLAAMIDSAVGSTYEFFTNADMNQVADPKNLGPFATIGDVTYLVRTVATSGCLSVFDTITIHPVNYPVISITPKNVHTNFSDTLLFYKKGTDAVFELSLTEGDTTDWNVSMRVINSQGDTIMDQTNNIGTKTATVQLDTLSSNVTFQIYRVVRQGCVTDAVITYSLRVIPEILMTSSSITCTRTDTLHSGDTITICQGDEQFICAWVDTLLVNSTETWGLSFKNQTTGHITDMQFRVADIPYNMVATKNMSPGTYYYTVNELAISGTNLPNYVLDNALGLDYYLEIVKKLDVTVNPPAHVCSMNEFDLPLIITGGKDSVIVSYSIDEGTPENIVFYHPANDTIIAPLSIQGKAAGDTTKIQLISIASNLCDLILVPANYTFTFVFDTLPLLIDVDAINTQTIACNWTEFGLGLEANCHTGDMASLKMVMNVDKVELEYHETNGNWVGLNQYFDNGVAYFGTSAGFSLQDLSRQFRIKSTSQLYVDSVPFALTVISATDSLQWSLPMEGYLRLLGSDAELFEIDSITIIDTLGCDLAEFTIEVRANCHADSLANVMIAMDVTGLKLEYDQTGSGSWTNLTQSFINDTCYFGSATGFPLRDTIIKFRIQSATTKFIENVDYSFMVVDAKNHTMAWSAAISGNFAVLGTQAELLDFDSITKNITAVTCVEQEFEIGTRANCPLGDIVYVKVEMDTTGLLVEYYDGANFLPMNPYFINGAALYGQPTGFPLQNLLVAGTGSRFRVSSTGNKTGVVSYLIVAVDATTLAPVSDTIKGSFELRALPIATIVDPYNGEVCKNTTVAYTTEAGMATYAWTIAPGVNGTDYTYSGETTDTFKVIWFTQGTYTVSITYTDINNCTSSADSIINVLSIPSASLIITNSRLDVCPGTDVSLSVNAINATQGGVWRVVYSAMDHYNRIVKTFTADSVNGDSTLYATGLPAGKYRFYVDTITDMSSTATAKCPGFAENDTTTTTINIYPEIELKNIATVPTSVCINSGSIVLDFSPDSSLYAQTDVAIPHYDRYKIWVEDRNGVEYPSTIYPWAKAGNLQLTIPASAYDLGENTFKISRIYTGIGLGEDTLCMFDNLNMEYKFNVLDMPVVEIVGTDTACETTLSGATYRYQTSISLNEYKWSFATITGTDSVKFAPSSSSSDSIIYVFFTGQGHYQLYLAAKDSACENYDTLDVYVIPHPELVDIDNFLANLNYINCKTQEFSIGLVGNCRLGQDAKILISLDSAHKMLLEYYEPINAQGWTTISFINDTAYFHPTIGGFPITTTTNTDSIVFRITSLSDVRVEPISYSFVLVNAEDSSEVWSDPITGSVILTSVDTAAQIAAWTLDNNTIVNCTDQMFYVEITPNCQEGDSAKLRIVLDNFTDARYFNWTYSTDTLAASFRPLTGDYIVKIDSLIVASDTLSRIYFKISSNNDSVARDVIFNVYLGNGDQTEIWDSIVDQRIRLVKNDPLAMDIIQGPVGDSIICFIDTIKITYDPNCLLSDTNMGKLVISTDSVDIANLAVVYHEGTALQFGAGPSYRAFVDLWPGLFNKYTDTITFTVRSINPTTIDQNVVFTFSIVDTSSTQATLQPIANSDGNSNLPTITQNWKIKGKPATPIFVSDTIGFCQISRWVNFPKATNQPANSVYVWTNTNNDTVKNAYIGTYGVYDFNVWYYDTTTGCYGNDTLFVIDVSSDPNVLRMTSFVYCKEDTTDAFIFHDYFPENSPNVIYEYLGTGDPTIFGNNGFPYNGFDTIPSFVAYNPGTEPIILTYKVRAFDPNDTCNSGRNVKEFTITINPIPRIPTSITDMVYCNEIVVNVSESPFPANNGQYIYSWTRIAGDKIFANHADNGDNAFGFTAINSTDSVISATYTIKPRFVNYNESCGVDTVDFTISILPTPTVNPVNRMSHCANDTVPTVIFEGTGFTSFNWVKLGGGDNVGADIHGRSGKDSIPSFIALNNNVTAATATYTVTPVYELDGVICSGNATGFAIDVLPKPAIYTIPDQSICSGTKTTAVTFSGSATIFEWVWENVSTDITGLPTDSRNENGIAEYILTNKTTVLQTVTIAVIPSNSTCAGDTVRFNIDVYPQPTVNNIAPQTICSQSLTTNVIFGGTAESYTWKNIGSSIIGLPASGADSLGTHKLENYSSSPITATIEVTPINNNGSCKGEVKTFSITVNPEPVLTNLPADYVLCSGDRTTGATFTGTANLFTWVATAPGTTTGFPIGTQTGNFGTYTLTNSGTVVDTVKVTVTPKSNACSGISQTFKILVNPQPKITTTLTDQTICSGSSTTAVNFAGTGTFNWAVTNGQINGFPTSGTGNIASRVLNNTTTNPQTVEITVTPTYDGCTGTSMIFNITVNPAPTLTNKPTDATLCSGDLSPAVTFAGVATEFAWTVTPNGITGFTPTNGTNTFGPFTLTSTTAATATVNVTPKYGTCTAASASTFTITVNPLASVAITPSDTLVCHNQTVSYNFGTNDEWTATGDLITGLGLKGTGPLTALLENRGIISLTAIITVAPKSSLACAGASHQFKITVNPEPVVNNVPAAYTICNNTQTTPLTFAGVATKYEWTVSGNGNINGFPSGTQTGNFGTYTLTNTATTPQIATITVTPYYNHGGITTCPGATATFEITVNPTVKITNTLNDLTLCSGASTNAITFAGATDYEWIVTGDRIPGLPTGTQIGNFGSYTVTNNGTTTLTATVTVTPRYIDGGVNCAGTSISFNIIVSPATIITNVYANKTVFCDGETLKLTAEATGVNLSYQWYHNGTAISGATSAYYEISDVQEANAGDYYVIVSSGACGNVQSTQTITVEVRSGDMLLEKFSDVIFVDNVSQKYTGYQWYKNGSLINGSTKQYYQEVGGLKGCYYVVLTLANGSTETSCEKCFDKTKMTIKDWKLSVYPNPSKQGNSATATLTSMDVKYDGLLNVIIINMNGSEVVRMNNMEGQFDVETGQLAPGIYNVRVITEDGNVYNEKMIVY